MLLSINSPNWTYLFTSRLKRRGFEYHPSFFSPKLITSLRISYSNSSANSILQQKQMALKILKFSILEDSSSSINGGSVINEIEQPKESQKGTAKTGVRFLPCPILADILSRVPAKTVFGCMTVSKHWLSFIDNPFFRRQHFSRARICPLLIFDSIYSENKLNPITVHLVEGETVFDLDPQIGDHKLNSRIETCKGVNAPESEINGSLLKNNNKATSCEGLICSAPRHGCSGRDHVIICNPITREYLTINLYKGNNAYMSAFIGLGFSRVDNEFKLLRISKTMYGDSCWPELLVVGSKAWQRVEVPSMPPIRFARKVDDIIYVNGVIYWSYSGDNISICSFNFDDNEFRIVRLPGIVTLNMHMGVLGGSLCVSLISADDGHVELWIIEKDGGKTDWGKIMEIDSEATVMDHRGYLWRRGNYKAIKYLEGGKVLLHDWWGTFLVYDPVTKSDKLLCVLDNSYLNRLGTCFNFQVVPHVPSLVSLRDTINIEDSDCVVLNDY